MVKAPKFRRRKSSKIGTAKAVPLGWEKAFAAVDKPKREGAWGVSFRKHYKRLAKAHPYASKMDVFMLAGGFADADTWKQGSKKTAKRVFK